MEFEYWWVIGFPIFFGLGWLAARIDIKHLLSESRQLPESYFKGLNFLLNEQPDRAIEAFIEVVKGDRESIELHFTLGNLFRRRGETERAIRIEFDHVWFAYVDEHWVLEDVSFTIEPGERVVYAARPDIGVTLRNKLGLVWMVLAGGVAGALGLV